MFKAEKVVKYRLKQDFNENGIFIHRQFRILKGKMAAGSNHGAKDDLAITSVLFLYLNPNQNIYRANFTFFYVSYVGQASGIWVVRNLLLNPQETIAL